MSEQSIVQSVAEFVEAFDYLEWDRFCGCFAEDATVYFPFDGKPYLASGKSEVEAGFADVFERAKSATSGPPYLQLEPLDESIRIYGDTAIVTFHLERPQGIGRRTIIFAKRHDRWKILHLHASTMGA